MWGRPAGGSIAPECDGAAAPGCPVGSACGIAIRIDWRETKVGAGGRGNTAFCNPCGSDAGSPCGMAGAALIRCNDSMSSAFRRMRRWAKAVSSCSADVIDASSCIIAAHAALCWAPGIAWAPGDSASSVPDEPPRVVSSDESDESDEPARLSCARPIILESSPWNAVPAVPAVRAVPARLLAAGRVRHRRRRRRLHRVRARAVDGVGVEAVAVLVVLLAALAVLRRRGGRRRPRAQLLPPVLEPHLDRLRRHPELHREALAHRPRRVAVVDLVRPERGWGRDG